MRTLKKVEDLTDAYHVSATEVGFSVPVWHRSQVTLSKIEDAPLRCEGGLQLHKSPEREERVYEIEGELVGRQVFCMKGYRLIGGTRTDRDSFVATLNRVSTSGNQLIGIWSGRDDHATSGMSGTFILSKT